MHSLVMSMSRRNFKHMMNELGGGKSFFLPFSLSGHWRHGSSCYLCILQSETSIVTRSDRNGFIAFSLVKLEELIILLMNGLWKWYLCMTKHHHSLGQYLLLL